MVVSHGRPAYIIVNPDACEAASRPPTRPIRRGPTVREFLEFLASAPAPDPGFADDIEAIQASAGATPPRSVGAPAEASADGRCDGDRRLAHGASAGTG